MDESDPMTPIIRIKTAEEILKRREEINKYIWGESRFPLNRMPDKVEKGVDIKFTRNHKPLRIDKLSIQLPHGIISVIYHIIAKNQSNKLVIYHQGNTSEFTSQPVIADTLLGKKHSIMLISMLFSNKHIQPTIDVPGIGKTRIDNDLELRLLNNGDRSALSYHLEPIAAAINYSLASFDYKEINIIGFSGGAYLTTLYSAIDTRVKRSYVIDGQLPLFIQTQDMTTSHSLVKESMRFYPDLYSMANFLEMYLLGASGSNRRQMQILNEYPLGCIMSKFTGLYEGRIKALLNSMEGGKFDVFINLGHEHEVNKELLEYIIQDMEK